jgi:tRNA modification GTPase
LSTTTGGAGDTICALATSARSGGVGIIRLSGPRSLAILKQVATAVKETPPAHKLIYTTFTEASAEPAQQRIIDDGYAAFMPAPRSYTAEDVVELQGHGGATNLGRLLRAVIRAGARPAERGEFTLRAFLNGRIDLAQAEAVLDVVQARTETALDLAHDQLRGGLSDVVRTLLNEVADVLARLEVQIDFIDEDLGSVHGERPTTRLHELGRQCGELASTFQHGRVLRDGARVVLMGPPNAGKSSLFNALIRSARAIVTDIPGTTRDFIEETTDIGGLAVTLVDTAGIRSDASDEVESAGIERSLAVAEHADLVLWLSDARTPEPPPEHLSRVIALTTKADLSPGDVSVITGLGIADLLERIKHAVLPEGSREGDHQVVTSARHHEALVAATAALKTAAETCGAGESPELVAVDVQEAVTQLGLIVGETSSEDLLDRIFAEFCIGK